MIQCDYRYEHDMVRDVPAGERCDAKATHKIIWSDGRYSLACAAHLEIDQSASVKPRSITKLDARAK